MHSANKRLNDRVIKRRRMNLQNIPSLTGKQSGPCETWQLFGNLSERSEPLDEKN